MSVPKAIQSPWNMSILLMCEDLSEAARVRGDLALAHPFLVAGVPSLEKAFAELRRKPYDALLVDLGLPGQRAADTLLWAQSIAHRIPTVVLAGASETELAPRAIEGGVQDFLVKGQTCAGALARSLRYASVRHSISAELQRSLQASQGQRDPLTGLLSRDAFERKLQETLDFGERFGDRPAVLLIDLDRLRPSQERLGPMLGARLLQEVGRRLTWCVRRTDLGGRLGEDRLSVLLPHVAEGKAVEPVVERIRSALSEPFEIGPWKPRVTARVGAARFPEDGRTAGALLRRAEAALLEARVSAGGAA